MTTYMYFVQCVKINFYFVFKFSSFMEQIEVFFFSLQYDIRSDIKDTKNTSWQKVVAVVAFLSFVIALVATLILLLPNNGLYKAFINIYIEILKSEK